MLDVVIWNCLCKMSYQVLILGNSSSGRTIPLICDVFKTLLEKSDKFQSVFREVGLVNVFAATLSEIITVLRQRRDSGSDIDINEDLGDNFIDNAIISFDAICDTLVHMLRDSQNIILFLRSYVVSCCFAYDVFIFSHKPLPRID